MTVSPITSSDTTTTDRPSTNQKRDLRRMVNDTVDPLAEELGKEALQRLFGRRTEFKSDLMALVRKRAAKRPDYALAREILGDDFISPEDVRAVYPLQSSENMDSLPSEDDLRWLKANDYILVPEPHEYLTVLDVRNLDKQLFYSKTGGWCENHKFSRNERTGGYTSWLAIKKTPVNGSTNKTWTDQNKLLSDVEHVPNAAEFTWAVTIYHKVRGVYLFPDVYVRVSSLGSDGSRVYVGYFAAGGLGVSGYWGDDRDSCLGLSSARKF
jgi:hypothetical protein